MFTPLIKLSAKRENSAAPHTFSSLGLVNFMFLRKALQSQIFQNVEKRVVRDQRFAWQNEGKAWECFLFRHYCIDVGGKLQYNYRDLMIVAIFKWKSMVSIFSWQRFMSEKLRFRSLKSPSTRSNCLWYLMNDSVSRRGQKLWHSVSSFDKVFCVQVHNINQEHDSLQLCRICK